MKKEEMKRRKFQHQIFWKNFFQREKGLPMTLKSERSPFVFVSRLKKGGPKIVLC